MLVKNLEFFLSWYVSNYIISSILPAGLQSLKYLFFGLLQKNSVDFVLYSSVCTTHGFNFVSHITQHNASFCSFHKYLFETEVLVAQSCLTFCDSMDCSP